jgi:hypothetical protein
MLEWARKHGPFDDRYPARHKLPAPSRDLQLDGDGGERLEWSTFLTRFYPNRRRHDFAALAAYEAYRNTLAQEAPQQRPPTHRALPRRRDGRSRNRPAGRAGARARVGRSVVRGSTGLGVGRWRVGRATGALMRAELGFRRGSSAVRPNPACRASCLRERPSILLGAVYPFLPRSSSGGGVPVGILFMRDGWLAGRG